MTVNDQRSSIRLNIIFDTISFFIMMYIGLTLIRCDVPIILLDLFMVLLPLLLGKIVYNLMDLDEYY